MKKKYFFGIILVSMILIIGCGPKIKTIKTNTLFDNSITCENVENIIQMENEAGGAIGHPCISVCEEAGALAYDGKYSCNNNILSCDCLME